MKWFDEIQTKMKNTFKIWKALRNCKDFLSLQMKFLL